MLPFGDADPALWDGMEVVLAARDGPRLTAWTLVPPAGTNVAIKVQVVSLVSYWGFRAHQPDEVVKHP